MPAPKGNQYNKRLNPCTEQVAFRITPGMKDLYEKEAKACGKSISGVLQDAMEHQIYERMVRGGEFFTCEGRKKLGHLLKQTAEG